MNKEHNATAQSFVQIVSAQHLIFTQLLMTIFLLQQFYVRLSDTEALAVSDEKESSDPIVNPSLFSLYSLPHIYIYISTRPHTHKEKKGNKEKFRQKMTQ